MPHHCELLAGFCALGVDVPEVVLNVEAQAAPLPGVLNYAPNMVYYYARKYVGGWGANYIFSVVVLSSRSLGGRHRLAYVLMVHANTNCRGATGRVG